LGKFNYTAKAAPSYVQLCFIYLYIRLGRESGYPSQSSDEVKNAWSYTSTPPIRLRLHGVVLSLSTWTTLPLPLNKVSQIKRIATGLKEVCLEFPET
jgi:hypothetical protein